MQLSFFLLQFLFLSMLSRSTPLTEIRRSFSGPVFISSHALRDGSTYLMEKESEKKEKERGINMILIYLDIL
jgi:hypothetical protein